MPDESTIERYRDSYLRHLPPGKAIARDPDRNIPRMLEALAVEPARVTERVADLIREAFPGTTDELIDEWEEALGLPDDCVQPTLYADRIAAIIARFVGTSGHSEDDYRELAQSLGYDGSLIAFERQSAFRADISRAGDRCADDWAWTLHVTVVGIGDAVRDALLECAFDARRRAHTSFEFSFSDEQLSYDGDGLFYGADALTYG